MINKVKTFFKKHLVIIWASALVIFCFFACGTENDKQPLEKRVYELDLINGKTYTVAIECHRDAKEFFFSPIFQVRAPKYNYFGIPNGRNWWDYTCNGVIMYRRVK